MSWTIVFKTKSRQGNLRIERRVQFADGMLKITDDVEKATLLLTHWTRGIHFDYDHVEGDLPLELVAMVENSPFGTHTADSATPYTPEREMVRAHGASVPPTPGVEVVEGQPEGPEEVAVSELVGAEEEQAEVPAVEVDSTDDLFLLDKPGLEAYAKGIGIDEPADFRNVDMLIEAVIAKLEADGRVGADGEIVEAVEVPEHVEAPEIPEEPEAPESAEYQIPTKKALEEMNFEGVVSFALELIKERGADIPPDSFKTKGKLVKALLKLEE